ncbi:hypothetical protein JR316_0012415 [Psilocybe cubensis]|uniref:AB hydrolase-1 domain-containing protein n=2 Tax=Psilocybe cubensis TaxID=181762 RepID=A0A8H7XNH8_PSICU|nr:hypothetical protein JR316_0012415 [Psilocybe cubensis]KAH9475304.1 hypothetical protein JR316_0012415 [Psilocybe cubensis]
MPTATVGNGITFHYTDSGLPVESDYFTVIIVHGHSFSSGLFQKLSLLAPSQSLRVICIDRREYNGSTPFTLEELQIINQGSEEERSALLTEQGLLLALLIDDLIQTLSLPLQNYGAISGWSLGNVFTVAMINAIDHPELPRESKGRLKAFLRTYIIWDTVSQLLGIESPPGFYFPFWDYDIPEEERGAVIKTYISSHFNHGADVLALCDTSRLNHRHATPGTSTIDRMTEEELQSVVDFQAGAKCDTAILEPSYYKLHYESVQKALLDEDSNTSKWGMTVWNIYGENGCWNILHGSWALKEKSLQANKKINFKPVKGKNHFLMWEDPECTITVLKDCLV